jgi:hypothetical protein
MLIVAMGFAGFLVGIGIGGYFGKMSERRDWDKLIKDGVLPIPGQRWKPEDYKKSEKSEK